MPEQPSGNERQKLADLDRRLESARSRGKRPGSDRRRKEFTAASMAWRMVIELVMAIMIGGAMGWGLDALFGSRPLFLIVFVVLGGVAGVRLVLRTAEEMNREGPEGDERDSN